MKQTGSLHSQVYQGLAAVFLLLFLGSGGESRAEAVTPPQTSSTAEFSKPQHVPRAAVRSTRAKTARAATLTVAQPAPRVTPSVLPKSPTTPTEDSASPPHETDLPASNENHDSDLPQPTPSPTVSAIPVPSPLINASSHESSAADLAEIEALIKQIELELDQLKPLPTPSPTKNPDPTL